jgi:hypothetical protein
MVVEDIIKRALKRLKRVTGLDVEDVERELIPLKPEEHLKPKIVKKKKK